VLDGDSGSGYPRGNGQVFEGCPAHKMHSDVSVIAAVYAANNQ